MPMVVNSNDGKTRQQKYVERNREKVNAANAKRNRERHIKRKLIAQCPIQTEPQGPRQSTITESPRPLLYTSNALATSAHPEALSKRQPDPTLLEDFSEYRERFRKFQDHCSLALDEYSKGSDFSRGWVAKISYKSSGLSKKIRRLDDEGFKLVEEGSNILKRLSYSIDTHLGEWEEASQAHMHMAGYLRVLDHIEAAYRIAYARQQARKKAREEELPIASD